MTVGGGEAADQMVRMMLSGGEVAVRLGGSALKNLLALTMALAKNNQTISGKVNMTRMLRETRDLRLFPMSPEQYKQFQKHAKKQKILFSAIKDKDDKGKLIDVVLPVTELDRANLIFERIMYQGPARQAPEREERPAPSPEKERQGQSPDRDKQEPQQAQEDPQERPTEPARPMPQGSQDGPEQTPDRWSPPPPRSRLPDDPWEIPPKKDSRSGRDSRDTKTRSSIPNSSREGGATSEKPSILGRLAGYRAQLDSRKQSVPTREKTKVKPKLR
ncbi:MAG: DUF3801 domain-containing protein [Clostridiales bacterium]|nr:DUF3801 domain-containing protein [Clostridiales bacterium]